MNYSEEQTREILLQVEKSLQSHLIQKNIDNPIIIGIRTGGAWIADHLSQSIKSEGDVSYLNISFYRDDFSKVGVNPKVEPSSMPHSIDDKHVILVDDVLHTGLSLIHI